MAAQRRELAFVNAKVITCIRGRQSAEALLVADGRIAAVGTTASLMRRAGASCRVVDVGGLTIVPGLIDAHCHVFGSAAARVSVDCSPAAAPRLDDVLGRLRAAVGARGAGEWVSGVGFDEVLVAEGRFPTRSELDAVVPGNPVELRHGGGHVVALNTLARVVLGVDPSDDAPVPNGAIRGCVRRHPSGELEAAVKRMSRDWLRYGTTFLQDAGIDNGPSEVAALRALARSGAIRQRVAILVGAGRANGALRPCEDVRVNGVKLAVTEATLSSVTLATLAREIRRHVASGLVAIHVVELGALAALIDVLTELEGDGLDLERVRLEHVSVCPGDWAPILARLGVTVVTQPAFLSNRGERYRRLVPLEQHGWLYPTAELLAAGVPVAGSSDSPVATANPFVGMAAAIERRARTGFRFAGRTLTDRQACLALYTSAAATAVGRRHDLGRLRAGYFADLAILDRDPVSVPVDELVGTTAVATFLDGRCVHGQDWLSSATVTRDRAVSTACPR